MGTDHHTHRNPGKMVPEKWSPEKWFPRKMVPENCPREKWSPENWSPEKWSPENWSPGNSETKNRGVGVEHRGVCVKCLDAINLWKPKTRQQIFLDSFSVLQFGTYLGSCRKRQTFFWVCSGTNFQKWKTRLNFLAFFWRRTIFEGNFSGDQFFEDHFSGDHFSAYPLIVIPSLMTENQSFFWK